MMQAEHALARDIVERMATAWIQADIPAIVDLFAPDGVFISPGGRAEGHTAIAALATAFFAASLALTVTIRRVLVNGDVGAIEWIWTETDPATNQRRTMEDAIVFELRDGKLIYWREYFDPAQTREL